MNSIVISIEQTELEIWFERDRAHVELRNAQTGATILEFWDDDVSGLVEDGFLNPRNWHDSLYDYAAYLSVIQRTEAGAPMSRQDYVKLVEALRYGLGSLQADCFTRAEAVKAQEHFAAHIAEAFADNPLFNREHFLAVVRGERDLLSHARGAK